MDKFRVEKIDAIDPNAVSDLLNLAAEHGWHARSLNWIHDADVHTGSWWVLYEWIS